MLRDDLIKAIKTSKGPIYMACSSRHDTYYIQGVKTDMIATFNFRDNTETYMRLDQRHGAYYLDSDNLAED